MKQEATKRTAFVFSHAHWDIEWYLPLRSFRFWLVKSLDRLIDPVSRHPGFKTFVFDGQVAPIDHYLEVKPENEPAIRKLIQSVKLSIGPFYTQYDEWLTGPEAIVRNCLYGNRRARGLGRVMKAGYLPDTFGHPAQMPQILNGFGLKSLIFMRGMPVRSDAVGDQFHWVGLDGTRVLGVHLRHSYCNALAAGSKTNAWGPPAFRAAAFGDYIQTSEFLHRAARETDMKKGVADLLTAAQKAESGCHTGVIPLANGYDSAVAQETIAELIALANKQQDEFEFVHGNCEDLTNAIARRGKNLKAFKGELWGGKYQLLLTGAITTRSYLKQANFASEALLERYAEPLCVLASLDGAAWPARQLEEAWRWLFLNQAHDGIHGSSADPVHEEMVHRFNAARQIAVGLTREALAVLAARRDDKKQKGGLVLAYNPAGSAADPAIVDAWLHGYDPARHVLVDASGRPLPVQVVANPWAADQPSKTASWAPAWPDGHPTHVLVAAPVPPGGLAALRMREGKAAKPRQIGKQSATSIENEHLRVSFRRGALEVYDKTTRRTYAGLNVIEDAADRGDAWDLSEPWVKSPVLRSTDFPSLCRLVEAGPVRAMLEITTRMRVPKRLEGEKRSRELDLLKTEVAALKAENATLRGEGQVLRENVQALEEQAAKDSHHSSKPPSSDGLAKPKPKSLRPPSERPTGLPAEAASAQAGGQPGHPGHTLRMVEKPDRTVRHAVERCKDCGRSLAQQQPERVERRQAFDLPEPKLEVSEHQGEIKTCPSFSEGTLANFGADCSRRLEPVEAAIRALATPSEVAGFDETGVRAVGSLHWLHTVSTQFLTWDYAHKRRGREAMDAAGILPGYLLFFFSARYAKTADAACLPASAPWQSTFLLPPRVRQNLPWVSCSIARTLLCFKARSDVRLIDVTLKNLDDLSGQLL